MLGSSDLVAFVATTDLDRARAFCAEVVGLAVIEESPHVSSMPMHGEGPGVAGVVFGRFPGTDQDDIGGWSARGAMTRAG